MPVVNSRWTGLASQVHGHTKEVSRARAFSALPDTSPLTAQGMLWCSLR